MKEQVAAVLDKVRPVLQRDGGDVELVEVSDDGVVLVRLQGACSGCPGTPDDIYCRAGYGRYQHRSE